MKKQQAFGFIAIIIAISALIGLGAAGYFVYTSYFATSLAAEAKMIPRDLQSLAIGENATSFLIINVDSELNKLIQEIPEAKDFTNLTGVVLAASSPDSVDIALSFTTAEAAGLAKSMIEKNNVDSEVEVIIEQKNNILINKSLKSNLKGKFADNQLLKKLNPEMLDSQIIVYASIQPMIDNFLKEQFKDLSFVLPLIKVAHAQGTGFISATDETSRIATATGGGSSLESVMSSYGDITLFDNLDAYIRIKDRNFRGTLSLRLIPKENYLKLPLITKYASMTGATPLSLYEINIASITKALAFAEIFKTSLEEQFNKKLTFTINFNNPASIDAKISGEITPEVERNLRNLWQIQQETPAIARDAASKAAVNNIVAVVEGGIIINGKLPPTSCVDDNFELVSSFKKIPENVIADQKFGDIDCGKHYYFQNLDNKAYAVWARTVSGSGNADLTPEEFADQWRAGEDVEQRARSGQYFVLTNTVTADLSSPSSVMIKAENPAPVKVPRVKK